MSELNPVDVPMSRVIEGDYTPDTVPRNVLDAVVKDRFLYVDVFNAGAMAATNLGHQAATDRGLIKNHWSFRVDFGQDGRQGIGQIQFTMDVMREANIPSNVGQYVSSIRSDPDTDSNLTYSDLGSTGKPPAVGSQGSVSFALPDAAAPSGDGSHDTQSVVFSDVESQGKPPNITSSAGVNFEQPTEGAPFPGVFNIKVRDRVLPGYSVIVVFRLELAAGTTFGQLLTDRHMEPFHFRKLGVAYLGCRDFISQATAAWLRDGLLVSGEAVMVLGGPEVKNQPQIEGDIEIEARHIFSRLGWRYTHPLVSVNTSDVSDPNPETERATCRGPSRIDRAVWPAGYVHIEDKKLQYNQVIPAT